MLKLMRRHDVERLVCSIQCCISAMISFVCPAPRILSELQEMYGGRLVSKDYPRGSRGTPDKCHAGLMLCHGGNQSVMVGAQVVQFCKSQFPGGGLKARPAWRVSGRPSS